MTIRVLLADDHALMREGLRALLTSVPDIDVVGEVRTGREAQWQVLQLDPDVVLMDIAMPDLNGIEAARLIHAKCPAVRIVMLSMHASAEYVYRAFEAGASGYLLKEAAVEEVIAAVRTVHEGKRYLSPALAESVPDLNSGHARSPVDSLSARERQVLQLVVEGVTSSEIAHMICLSPKSVQTYHSRLMMKLGVRDRPSSRSGRSVRPFAPAEQSHALALDRVAASIHDGGAADVFYANCPICRGERGGAHPREGSFAPRSGSAHGACGTNPCKLLEEACERELRDRVVLPRPDRDHLSVDPGPRNVRA